MQRLVERSDETMPSIEGGGVLVECVDDDEAGCRRLYRRHGHAQRFREQAGAQSGSLIGAVDREPGDPTMGTGR